MPERETDTFHYTLGGYSEEDYAKLSESDRATHAQLFADAQDRALRRSTKDPDQRPSPEEMNTAGIAETALKLTPLVSEQMAIAVETILLQVRKALVDHQESMSAVERTVEDSHVVPVERARIASEFIFMKMVKGVLFDLRMILEEAIPNGYRHGIIGDCRKRIQILSAMKPDGDLVITVEDEGLGFDPEELPSYAVMLEENHGKGLVLIDGYSDSKKLNERGNAVTITLNVFKRFLKNLGRATPEEMRDAIPANEQIVFITRQPAIAQQSEE